jgi:uncharacterized glyoxalase superfamily protein PhnB
MEEMRAPVDVCSISPDTARLHRDFEPHVCSLGAIAMKFSDVTPNLVAASVERSLAFYRDVLGFSVTATVPETAPFAFAWMQRDGVSVFLNSVESVAEHAALASRAIGGTATLFITIDAADPAAGIDALFASIAPRAPVVMALKDQFYGMREFGIQDPDGYVIFFAQQIAG